MPANSISHCRKTAQQIQLMSYIRSSFSPSSPHSKLSPNNKNKKVLPQQYEASDPLSLSPASPIKYLLQNNVKLNMGKDGQRTPQQLQIISHLLRLCTIFRDLDLSITQPTVSKQLSNGIVLIYCQSPHIMQIKDNELYVFFEGQGFEYMQNTFNKGSKKYHIYENNQYIMLRKINTNQYFLSMQDTNTRYHSNQKKYQLMVDQNTLIGKFSEEVFVRMFQGRILERQKNVIGALKKVQIFNGLPGSFFQEFSKFISEEKRAIGDKVIRREEKSKFVYFVKTGTAELHLFNANRPSVSGNPNYYVSNNRPYTLLPINPFDSFGMETPESDADTEKEVICTSDCVFFKIDKRLLAIIITSFELQFQQKNKVWSEVNINNQIKGQNYCSPEKELLLKNVERIRTSQRKIRDIKLKYLSSNKSKREIEPLPASKQDSYKDTIKESFKEEKEASSPEERKRMTKTTQGRFRSTSIIRFINHFAGIDDQRRYNAIRQQLDEEREKFITDRVNQIEIMAVETDDLIRSPDKLRLTNTFSYKEKLQHNKLVRSASKFQRYDSGSKFVPRMQVKSSTQGHSFKADSEMIGVFLDKKIKNEILKKAEKVCNINKNVKLAQSKHLKRLFAAATTSSSRQINAISEIDRKSIAEDIVDKMSNLRENPLLLQIESERRKIERQLKLSARRAKASENPSPAKKYKKEDQLILIRDYS